VLENKIYFAVPWIQTKSIPPTGRTGCPLLVLVKMVITVITYTDNKVTSSHLIDSRYANIVITTTLCTFVRN